MTAATPHTNQSTQDAVVVELVRSLGALVDAALWLGPPDVRGWLLAARAAGPVNVRTRA